MSPRIARLGLIAAAAAIVQLAVLVLAHELVFLARYGSRYGEALVHAGHGDGWRSAATTSVVLGITVAIVAVARLAWLHLQLRRARETADSRRLDGRALSRMWLRIGPALAIGTVALLTLQENLEQLAIHGTSAGLGLLLSPEYAGGLWIALAVGLVVGAVAALAAWRMQALLGRLRAVRLATTPRHAAVEARPTFLVDRPSTSILGRRSALRAPPLGVRS